MKRRVVMGIVAAGIAVGSWAPCAFGQGATDEFTLRLGDFAGELSKSGAPDTDPSATPESTKYVVQFENAPTRVVRNHLLGIGLSLRRYVGKNAYLEILDTPEKLALLDSELVHGWALASKAEFRLRSVRPLSIPRLGTGVTHLRVFSDSDEPRIVDVPSGRMPGLGPEDIFTMPSEERARIADSRGRRRRSLGPPVPLPFSIATTPTSETTVNLIDSWPVDAGNVRLQGRLRPKLDFVQRGAPQWQPFDDAPNVEILPNAHATFAAGIIVEDEDGPMVMSTRLHNDANLAWALQKAHDAGARIHVIPWHLEGGTYDIVAQQLDEFTWENEDDLVVCSDGKDSLGPPGIAKNAVTVAAASRGAAGEAVHEVGARAESRAPDLHAWGCGIRSLKGEDGDTDDGWDLFNQYCATSWAAPRAAVDAARVRQMYERDSGLTGPPTSALLRATLVALASPVESDNGSWGLADLTSSFPLSEEGRCPPGSTSCLRLVQDVRHARGLDTDESDSYVLHAEGAGATTITAVLAWNDPPPENPEHIQVNRLDMRILGMEAARRNEGSGVIRLTWTPQPGRKDWTIEVSSPAIHVVAAHRAGAPGDAPGQGYALVVTSDGPLSWTIPTRLQARSHVGTLPDEPPGERPGTSLTDRNPVPAKVQPDRFFRRWTELRLAGGAGLRQDEWGGLGAVEADHRRERFRRIPTTSSLKTSEGEQAGRMLRIDDASVGVTAVRDERGGSQATSDGARAWAYYDRSLKRRTPTTRAAWGILGDATIARADDDGTSSVSVSPALSFAWDSKGDCERNRIVPYATYAKDEEGDELSLGATLSFLRSEDGDRYEARCARSSIFRRLDLDDHLSYHVALMHLERSSDGGGDVHANSVAFQGQVPLVRPAPREGQRTYRHLTFDWSAVRTEFRRDAESSLPGESRGRLTEAGVGVFIPLRAMADDDGSRESELGLRFSFGGHWRDSDDPAREEHDAVVSLVLHATLGGGRSTLPLRHEGTGDAVVNRIPDVPASGSTLDPETGTGPGGVIVTTTPIR